MKKGAIHFISKHLDATEQMGPSPFKHYGALCRIGDIGIIVVRSNSVKCLILMQTQAFAYIIRVRNKHCCF